MKEGDRPGVNDSHSPLAVLLDVGDRELDWRRSAQHYGCYAVELLEHGGFPFDTVARADLAAAELPPLLLLPYRVRLTPEEAGALRAFVAGGGSVIACGGVEGGDELFGIESTRRYLGEAALDWPAGGLGLAARRLPVWGAQLAAAKDGLGTVEGQGGASGVALKVNEVGKGLAVYLAVDVCRSVVTMQQGRPVYGDSESAPDGTAAIADRILKADDGAVIDWEWRQSTPEGPAYAVPYADALRELLLAAIVHCAERMRVPLPVKWYWPNAVPAVGCLSYDTDSNEDADGWAFLEVVKELGVEGTWCVMYPGGYSGELYQAIRSHGDELALHYDALTSDLRDVEHCRWSREDFEHQLAWLRRETGVEVVVSQKNHVTRWEGWTELFRWVELAGIRVDQTKGPSKIGNLGFVFGSCHAWRPMDDAMNGNRLLDLLEIAFLTHDMWTSQRRVELRRLLLDAVVEHNGVAHFIFHPQRIHEEGMPEALRDLVEYGRSSGVEWWTSERIAAWESARRKARLRFGEREGLEVEGDAPGLTVVVFGLGPEARGEPFDAFGGRGLRVTP